MTNHNLQIAQPKKKPIRSTMLSNGRDHRILDQEMFTTLLCLERKRAERSGNQFALILVDARKIAHTDVIRKMTSALSASTRETDIMGWYEGKSVLGIIFTEIGAELAFPMKTLLHKVNASLRSNLGSEMFAKIQVSFHLFPQEWDDQNPDDPADAKLYPDLAMKGNSKRFSRAVKRMIDIGVSGLVLLVLSPLLLIISAVIKLTSKGPVLFRQERVGQFGKKFEFLKFRSMYNNSDPEIHKEYVTALISGKNGLDQSNGNGNCLYKLQGDPRITRFGKLLRSTSLDELPQFWNVLKGEMSLVGPRPPIPYEVASYDIWHRRRVLEARPGITGLWQVTGRSRTTFEEMVRLDLAYATAWSLMLDFKILLKTPHAVFSRDGAY